YKNIIYSIFGKVMTSYDGAEDKIKSSYISSRFRKREINENHRSIRYRISRLYETSIFSKVTKGITQSILTAPLNVYGILFFTFGFYSMLIMLLRRYAFSFTPIDRTSFVVSLIFIITALPLFFSGKTFRTAINESRICNFVFFNLLCVRKTYSEENESRSLFGAGSAVITGIILGSLTIVFSPFKTALGILAVVACIVIINYPESGIIAVFFTLPFLSTKMLIAAMLITEISYLLKCVRRKRVIRFSVADIFVLIFALFTLSGGLISVDIPSSVPKMLVFLCFIGAYFIVKNIIKSEKLIMCCLNGLAFSAAVVAIIGLFQYFFGSVSSVWLDTSMFSYIPGRAVSTFANPNVLGEYLILISPLIFSMSLISKSAHDRFGYFLAFLLCASCLIFTWSRGAWLGFIFAVLLFIILYSHRSFAYFIVSIPLLSLGALSVFGTSVAGRFLSIGNTADSSTLYRLNIWRGVSRMLSDTWLYGIGIGTEAFRLVYPAYSLAGTEVAPHSHSLYLQIITETGVFSLIIFLGFCFFFTSMILSCCKRSSDTSGKILGIGFLCGVFAFLIQGFTDYVWYNYRIYLLFWLITGLAAALCANMRERYTEQIIQI
ncbi:MAG: O-antigen ligase family protein, partial [Eubacteriales bacterium]